MIPQRIFNGELPTPAAQPPPESVESFSCTLACRVCETGSPGGRAFTRATGGDLFSCAAQGESPELAGIFRGSETSRGEKSLPRTQASVPPCMAKRGLLPSFSIPTLRHFMKRQAWQDLRLRFVISHSLVAGQLYSMFPVSRHRRVARCCPHLPATGWMGIHRPNHYSPAPRFPQGSGSPSRRRSETRVRVFPTLLNTEIPVPEVRSARQPQL